MAVLDIRRRSLKARKAQDMREASLIELAGKRLDEARGISLQAQAIIDAAAASNQRHHHGNRPSQPLPQQRREKKRDNSRFQSQQTQRQRTENQVTEDLLLAPVAGVMVDQVARQQSVTDLPPAHRSV